MMAMQHLLSAEDGGPNDSADDPPNLETARGGKISMVG